MFFSLGINLSCKVQSLNDGTQRNRSCIASAQNDSIDATDDVVEGISSAANSPSEIVSVNIAYI